MQRVARLILLFCTVFGVAALHTIGHAAVMDTDQHAAAQAPYVVSAIDDDDGCDGDGCTHQLVMPGNGRDGSQRWEACLADLSTLSAGAFVAALLLMAVLGLSLTPATRRRFRMPLLRQGPPHGLTLTTLAVIRT